MYKVDQLTTMRWIKAAWKSIDSSVFVNCWRHTSLLSFNDETLHLATTEGNENESADFEAEFNHLLNSLNVKNPMSVDEYLHPQEESNAHVFLSDTDILEAAMIVDDDVDVQENVELVSLILPEMSRAESIAALSTALIVLKNEAEKWDNEIEREIHVLRKTQKALEQKERSEKEHKLQQTSITKYFVAS